MKESCPASRRPEDAMRRCMGLRWIVKKYFEAFEQMSPQGFSNDSSASV